MMTTDQAIAEGFTVDHYAPGRPLAYKGSRLAPTETAPVLTTQEEALTVQLYRLTALVELNHKIMGFRSVPQDAAEARKMLTSMGWKDTGWKT